MTAVKNLTTLSESNHARAVLTAITENDHGHPQMTADKKIDHGQNFDDGQKILTVVKKVTAVKKLFNPQN